MRIYTIRHGETEANSEGRFQGRTDGMLNENGISLAWETAEGMKQAGIHFDECFSSTLSRAADTAQIILQGSGNAGTPVHYDGRLMEADVGGWDMLLMKDMDRHFIETYMTEPFTLSKEEMRGGETMQEVCDRTQSFLKELIERDDDKTYLVSTHGAAVRAMCRFLCPEGNFWQGRVPYNCAVNIIDVKDGKAVMTELDHVFYDASKCVDHYGMKQAE